VVVPMGKRPVTRLTIDISANRQDGPPSCWGKPLLPARTLKNPWAPGVAPSSYGIVQSIARGFNFDDVKFDSSKDLDFSSKEILNRLEERHPVWGVTQWISPDTRRQAASSSCGHHE